jgi:hypothetical protein
MSRHRTRTPDLIMCASGPRGRRGCTRRAHSIARWRNSCWPHALLLAGQRRLPLLLPTLAPPTSTLPSCSPAPPKEAWVRQVTPDDLSGAMNPTTCPGVQLALLASSAAGGVPRGAPDSEMQGVPRTLATRAHMHIYTRTWRSQRMRNASTSLPTVASNISLARTCLSPLACDPSSLRLGKVLAAALNGHGDALALWAEAGWRGVCPRELRPGGRWRREGCTGASWVCLSRRSPRSAYSAP